MRSELRWRQVHLDFHTSEHIPDVGARFDKAQFIAALREGNVDSVTVFARCHHGWCYYPTRVGKPHPNLVRPDLLGEMLEACREAGINAPVYLSVQWDERMAREEPGWRVMSADNSRLLRGEDRSALGQLSPVWHPLCLAEPRYVDYVIALALEVVDLYRPDGLFLDILLSFECVCPRCLRGMRERGLDPERAQDRRRHDYEVLMEYYRRMSEAVWAKAPDMRLFHNSGHIFRGQRERYRFFSHLEVESLPTGGWGYDHFPISARYAATLGLEYVGMTGKFHTTWGEFGGFKRPVALDYECALMAALGARCSVGDQLHPSGWMEETTYRIIGPAYRRIQRMEPYLRGATPLSEIAVLSSEAHTAACEGPWAADQRHDESDAGAVRMLLELHAAFDVIDWQADLARYRLLVLPDHIVLPAELAERLNAYLAAGGSLLVSGTSGLRPDLSGFAIPLAASFEGASEWSPDYLEAGPGLDPDLPSAPLVIYERACKVRATSGARVLAGTRLPYFQRTWERFSSHQHAPYRLERNEGYDAAIQDGRIVYLAHPIFQAYYRSGQPLLKYLVRGAIRRLLPDPLLEVDMPSSGRVSLMEQESLGRIVVHLLFAQTQARGSGLPRPGGAPLRLEIIEDAVPVFDVRCRLRLPSAPRAVTVGYDARPLPARYEAGVLSFEVPRVDIHELVAIQR